MATRERDDEPAVDSTTTETTTETKTETRKETKTMARNASGVNGVANGAAGTGGNTGSAAAAKVRDVLASPVALFALLGFAAMAAFLLTNLSMTESEWNRASIVYTSVEAIAFAAAGYLFGKEVHRERAEKAEAKADEAETAVEKKGEEVTEAKTAQAEALTNGRALKQMIRAKAEGISLPKRTAARADRAPMTLMAEHEEHLDELVKVAQELFPG